MSKQIELPKGHEFLQRARVSLPLSGARYEVYKLEESSTGKPLILARDAEGKTVDHAAALRKETALVKRTYGKLHPVLHTALEKAGANGQVEAWAWLAFTKEEPSKTAFKERELAADKTPQAIVEFRKSRQAFTEKLAKALTKGGKCELTGISATLPVFSVKGDAASLKELAGKEEVLRLMLCEREGVNDLDASLAISEAEDVIALGDTGDGVNVAVWEQGPDDESELDIDDHFGSNSSSAHARLVSGIIKNRQEEGPHGYAPDCDLFSANSYSTDALEWAVNKKVCRVVNQSFHRASEQTSGDLSSDDILKDQMILEYPYPTIIQAAGNGDDKEFVNHKGYNSLAVGSHNDTATGMASTSVFRNPTTAHGDRELPEICANGTGVTAVGDSSSGTSFASPAVAGTAAVLMGINSGLRIWPEGARAILLAGATRNVRGGTWRDDLSSDTDARDGSGALNARESARIAGTRVYGDNAPVRRGWAVGRLDNGDFDKNGWLDRQYSILVPKRGGRRIKVALCWDGKPFEFLWWKFGSSLTVDLDLRVYKGSTRVASSSSWDNSYEIVEFDADPGAEYTIKVKRYSGKDWTYFGLAWTVF